MVVFTQEDMQEASDNLKIAAAVMKLLVAMKSSDEVQTILKGIPQLAAELKPMLEGLNTFLTQMDIDAIKQIEAAGIERPYAVALQMKRSPALNVLELASKGAKAKTTGKK